MWHAEGGVRWREHPAPQRHMRNEIWLDLSPNPVVNPYPGEFPVFRWSTHGEIDMKTLWFMVVQITGFLQQPAQCWGLLFP